MNHPHRLLLVALLGATSCTTQVHDPEHQEDDAPVLVAQGDALRDVLQADEDGWARTPPLHGADLFDRIALRFDADAPVAVQARFSADGGETWGAWRDAAETFVEGVARNAHADADVDLPTTAQLRFLAPTEAGLTFLATELFVAGREEAIDVGGSIEQGLAADGVVVARGDWGALPRVCGSAHTPSRITIHHTVTPNNDSMSMAARIRQIQSFHIASRGWCDIGYHFLVGQDGQVYQGRYENKTGAHAAGANTNNVGVSFVGDFSSAAPSSSMLDAGARIVRALAATWGIGLNRDRIVGHRQVGTTSTACPGQQLYGRLDDLIARASGANAAPPAAQAPAAPAPAGCGLLASGASLAPGQSRASCDGRFVFVHQHDGNVVLYQGGTALWASHTAGTATSTLVMQGDGNLVLYKTGGAARWSTATHGHPGARLAVQNDGNVVVYEGSTPLWATGTCCR